MGFDFVGNLLLFHRSAVIILNIILVTLRRRSLLQFNIQSANSIRLEAGHDCFKLSTL